jgi:hypothetical protein
MWGSETVQFDHSDLTRLTLYSQSATLFFLGSKMSIYKFQQGPLPGPTFLRWWFQFLENLFGGSGNNGYVSTTSS